MTIQLQTAINNARTFQDLIPIANQLEAKLSFFGRKYVVIEPRNSKDLLAYAGEAPIGALVNRTLKIIQETGHTRFDYPANCLERTYTELLDDQIDRFYAMDRENVKNSSILTKVCIFVRAIFSSIWNLNLPYDAVDHRFQWMGNEGSYVGLDGHILEPIHQNRFF